MDLVFASIDWGHSVRCQGQRVGGELGELQLLWKAESSFCPLSLSTLGYYPTLWVDLSKTMAPLEVIQTDICLPVDL